MKGVYLEEMHQYCENCKKDTIHRFIYGLHEKVCVECYIGSAELEAHYKPMDESITMRDIITRKKNRGTAFYKK